MRAMPKPLVTLNNDALRIDLCELVRRIVEEMLSGLLGDEVDDSVGAECCRRKLKGALAATQASSCYRGGCAGGRA